MLDQRRGGVDEAVAAAWVGTEPGKLAGLGDAETPAAQFGEDRRHVTDQSHGPAPVAQLGLGPTHRRPRPPANRTMPVQAERPAAISMVEHRDHLRLASAHLTLEVRQPLAHVLFGPPIVADGQRDTELVAADRAVNRSFGSEHCAHESIMATRVWHTFSPRSTRTFTRPKRSQPLPSLKPKP